MTSPTSLRLLDYCEYEMVLAHTPVLLEELVDLLAPQRGDAVFDATFGAGGHAEAVAGLLGDRGEVLPSPG